MKGNGIGLGTVLAIVFVVLKLTNVIAWSWWWVLSPLWIPFGLALAVVVVIALVAGIKAGIEDYQARRVRGYAVRNTHSRGK